MSKKKKTPMQEAPAQEKRLKLPTQEQQNALKKHRLNVVTWEVMEEQAAHLILRHRITGERKVVGK